MEIKFSNCVDGLKKETGFSIMVIGTITKENARKAFEDMCHVPKRIVTSESRMAVKNDDTYTEAEVQFFFDENKNMIDAAITPVYSENGTDKSSYGIHMNAKKYFTISDISDALKYYEEWKVA